MFVLVGQIPRAEDIGILETPHVEETTWDP